jgi:phage-related protein
MRIILDDDPHFYYFGRLSVSKFTSEKNIGIISVDAECEPYKYKLDKTVVELYVNGDFTAQVPNSRKRVVPEVEVEATGSIRIVYQGNIWDLGSGSYTLPELELVEGNNEITLAGVGTVTLTYQEATL